MNNCYSMCGAWVKGIVPGSVFAITILKMALMSEIDALIETCPRSLVAMYVDDLALSTYGTEQDVIADHSKVTLTAIELFENAGLPVSRGKDGKSVFMASNFVLAMGSEEGSKTLALGKKDTPRTWV